MTRCVTTPARAIHFILGFLPPPALLVLADSAHAHTTMFATVSALDRGLIGYGLGAVLGGILYSSLGARLCFGVFAALPSVALLFLATGSCGKNSAENGGKTQAIEEEEGLEG